MVERRHGHSRKRAPREGKKGCHAQSEVAALDRCASRMGTSAGRSDAPVPTAQLQFSAACPLFPALEPPRRPVPARRCCGAWTRNTCLRRPPPRLRWRLQLRDTERRALWQLRGPGCCARRCGLWLCSRDGLSRSPQSNARNLPTAVANSHKRPAATNIIRASSSPRKDQAAWLGVCKTQLSSYSVRRQRMVYRSPPPGSAKNTSRAG